MTIEWIYKIIDLTTDLVIMTGRTAKPPRREMEYRRKTWWREHFRFQAYRKVERVCADYGTYAAAVEHLEICRNRSWSHQGGRNVVSPLCQHLWTPEVHRQITSAGGRLSGGGKRNKESGFMRAVGLAWRGKKRKDRRTPEGKERQRQAAQIQGCKNKESGQIYTITTPESLVKGGKAALAKRGGSFGTTTTRALGRHIRWHKNRNIKNHDCIFCEVA